MSDYGFPVLYTLVLWWTSTGLILYLDRLPRSTFRRSLLGATAILALACIGLALGSSRATPLGAYVAFSCALLVWGWNELAFLTGTLSGPRRTACPEGCRGGPHFVHAVEAILYHELAILASLLLLWLLTRNAPNPLGLWTFGVLWAMRLSTKLNLFFGVWNTAEELLPDHLAYLKSFFTKKRMNALFPLSVTVATAATALVFRAALDAPTGSYEATGLTLLGTLMVLAVVEHWFLVLPLPAGTLWSWVLRSPAPDATPPAARVVRLSDEIAERGRRGAEARRRGDR